MKEQQKYEIIKKLIKTNGNKNTAALKLSCTRRHINRMIIGYETPPWQMLLQIFHFANIECNRRK